MTVSVVRKMVSAKSFRPAAKTANVPGMSIVLVTSKCAELVMALEMNVKRTLSVVCLASAHWGSAVMRARDCPVPVVQTVRWVRIAIRFIFTASPAWVATWPNSSQRPHASLAKTAIPFRGDVSEMGRRNVQRKLRSRTAPRESFVTRGPVFNVSVTKIAALGYAATIVVGFAKVRTFVGGMRTATTRKTSTVI